MKELKGTLPPGKVLIKVKEAATQTAGGLYIPGKAQKKFTEGEVMKLGTKISDKVIKLSIGDVAHYNEYVGIKLILDDVEYLSMDQKDILYVD